MKTFNSLFDAAQYAATIADGWCFSSSDDTYIKATLMILAETADDENPIDEDCYYVVSPGGSIGFWEDVEDIDWQFIANQDIDVALPETYTTVPQINFCPKCGNSVMPDTRFCGKCGNPLR